MFGGSRGIVRTGGTALALGCLVAALASAVIAPWVTFLVAPLILGPTHVAVDVWLLVVRPRAWREARALLVSAAGSLAIVCGAGLPGVAAVAAGGAFVARPGSNAGTRKGRFVLVAGLLAVACGVASDRLFVHLHNVVAVVAFVAVTASRTLGAGVVALVGCGAASILAGAFDSALVELTSHDATLAFAAALDVWPRWHRPERSLALFVFGQGVHYTLWLWSALNDARAVWHESSNDDGDWDARTLVVLAGASLAATVFLVVFARIHGTIEARSLYLRFAFAHTYAELWLLPMVVLREESWQGGAPKRACESRSRLGLIRSRGACSQNEPSAKQGGTHTAL